MLMALQQRNMAELANELIGMGAKKDTVSSFGTTNGFPREESPENQSLLENYLKAADPERVDLDIISQLIEWIVRTTPQEEAVLVFLPGLDDILSVKRILLYEEMGLKGKVQIFVLHSSIQSKDQRLAFKSPPSGIRKILLSTNISESSITVLNFITYEFLILLHFFVLIIFC